MSFLLFRCFVCLWLVQSINLHINVGYHMDNVCCSRRRRRLGNDVKQE